MIRIFGSLAVTAALGASLLVAAGAVSERIQAETGEQADPELPFFPSGRLLDAVSLGQPTAGADLAWLTAIQYYGKHHLGDQRYPLAAHLFDVTTRLDPAFRNAYIFGALVLGEEAGDMDAARELLTRGIAANPDDWMIAFQRGFLEYMHGDGRIGATEMGVSAQMPGAPPYTARLAAHACARVGRAELAARLWEEMARSTDPATRALANERLRALREDRGGL